MKIPHAQVVAERSPNKLLVEEIKAIFWNHQNDPDIWTTEYIAAKYDIDHSKIGKERVNLINRVLVIECN